MFPVERKVKLEGFLFFLEFPVVLVTGELNKIDRLEHWRRIESS